MDTTVKPGDFRLSAAWTAHARARRAAFRALAKQIVETLFSISRITGIKEAVYTDEVRMGKTVLFRATGKDFVVTMTPELLYKPLVEPLTALLALGDDATPTEESGSVVKLVDTKRLQNNRHRAAKLKLIEVLYDMVANLKTHQSIRGGTYTYRVAIGSDCLLEATGSDYVIDESFGLMLQDFKAQLFNLLEVLGKGSDIEMSYSEAGTGEGDQRSA